MFFSFSVREFVVSVLFLKSRNAQQNLKWNSMPLNYCRCVCSTSVALVGILNLSNCKSLPTPSPILNVMYLYFIVVINKVLFPTVCRMADWLVFSKVSLDFLQFKNGSNNILWLPVPLTINHQPHILWLVTLIYIYSCLCVMCLEFLMGQSK